MRKLISIVIVWVVLTSMTSQPGIPRAQAMFIYNFSRLIDWPVDYKTGSFIIGIFGNSEVKSEISAYTTNKKVGAQEISVKTFNSPAEIGNCHILFVPFSKTKNLPEITKVLGSKSTLIVGEKNGAIDNGASINFVVVGDKLKFEIKPSNANSKQINFSSRLNEMAYKIY